MSRNVGTFNFSANIEVRKAAPLDAKQKVTDKASLVTPATWNQSGDVWLYDGAIVAVSNDSTPENNGIYWLCDSANYTSYNSWIKTSTGGTGSGVGTLTGATNGISITGGDTVTLGGSLVNDTTIDGTGTYKMCYNDVAEFNANSGTSIAMCYNSTELKLLHSNNCAIIDLNRVGLINGSSSISVCDSGIGIISTGSSVTMKTDEGFIYGGSYTSTNPNWIPSKTYVDTVAAGLSVRDSAYVATTGNMVLSGLTTVDGILLTSGQRILVKDQTDDTENGIYSASTGIWGRTSDYDFDIGEISNGDLIPVVTGDTQYNSLWALTSTDPVSSGDSITFTLFNKEFGYVQGTGISINVNEISVDGSSLAGDSISWNTNQFNVDTTTGSLSTALGTKLNTSIFNTFTGTTLPADYYNKTQINTYTGTTDTRISAVETITAIAVTGGTNGLTKTGRNICLGGNLSSNVVISGGSSNSFTLGSSTSMLDTLYSYVSSLVTINAKSGTDNYTNVNLTPEHLKLIAYVSGSTSEIDLSTVGMIVTDNVSSKGLQYATNYRSNFTEYSLVDAGFVTGLTSLGLLTASNGLCVSGTDVKLGGNLTENTLISGSTNDLTIKSGGGGLASICFTIKPNDEFICTSVISSSTISKSIIEVNDSAILSDVYGSTTGYTKTLHCYTGINIMSNNCGHIKYDGDYSNTYTLRSVPDINYITGLTSQAIINTGDGLTKNNNDVRLGGEITQNICLFSTNATNCANIIFSQTGNSVSTFTKGGIISLCSVDTGGGINVYAPSGVTYTSCLHDSYVDRSLVDKEYVDKRLSFVNVRHTDANPFYLINTDYYIGVTGYTMGSCACLYLQSGVALSCGQKVTISDIQGEALAYPITIDGNGKCINGMSCGVAEINTNYGSISLIYNGLFWSPTAFVN